jgi:hypothetical protein
MRWADRLLGLWLGLAIFLQALLLAADASMSRAQLVQYFVGTLCVMLLVIYFWRSRAYLNSHVDMLLIMFASGGLGMQLGMTMSSHPAHLTHLVAWWRMCAWMFALGLVPAIAFSRCLRAARRHGYLLWALLIDSSAMLAGMWGASHLGIVSSDWTMMSRHFTMLGGMTLGMIVGMWIRSASLSERPLELERMREPERRMRNA